MVNLQPYKCIKVLLQLTSYVLTATPFVRILPTTDVHIICP